MAAAKKKEIEFTRIDAFKVVEAALSDADDNREVAFNALVADKELSKDVTDIALAEFWHKLLGEIRRNNRREIINDAYRAENVTSIWEPPESTGVGLAAIGENNRTIFDWQPPGLDGMILAKVTALELEIAARRQESSKKHSTSLLKVYSDIAGKLAGKDSGTTVADVFTVEELRKVFISYGVRGSERDD